MNYRRSSGVVPIRTGKRYRQPVRGRDRSQVALVLGIAAIVGAGIGLSPIKLSGDGQTSDTSESEFRYFRNCTDARAKGAAPIRAGKPGYRRHLDRDGDGIACEPYPQKYR